MCPKVLLACPNVLLAALAPALGATLPFLKEVLALCLSLHPVSPDTLPHPKFSQHTNVVPVCQCVFLCVSQRVPTCSWCVPTCPNVSQCASSVSQCASGVSTLGHARSTLGHIGTRWDTPGARWDTDKKHIRTRGHDWDVGNTLGVWEHIRRHRVQWGTQC